MGVARINVLGNLCNGLVVLLLLFISATSIADGSKVPPPKGEQCVEDPSWMRSNHFETILHQRDDTVLRGIRTSKHSLKNCIDCHITPNADGDYARYTNSEEHFCASCHSYAAVSVDCFQCHADRPESAVREAIRQQSSRQQHDAAYQYPRISSNANDLIIQSNLLSAQSK